MAKKKKKEKETGTPVHMEFVLPTQYRHPMRNSLKNWLRATATQETSAQVSTRLLTGLSPQSRSQPYKPKLN
jgi:hypothetical protein